MRVSTVLVTLLAAASSVLARPNRASRTAPLHSDAELDRRATAIVSARQFHYLHARNPLLDVCASINTNVILGNSEILGIPLKELLGIDICLCLSAFPIKLGLSAQIDALINKYGGPLINAVLELLVCNFLAVLLMNTYQFANVLDRPVPGQEAVQQARVLDFTLL